MSDFSAVIFDLDDTLFPERSFVISGFRAASEYAASVAPIASERLFRQLQDDFHAGVRGNSFEVALRSLDSYSAQLEAAMVEAYRDHEPRIKPFPGVVDTLQRLKKEHRIGLLSDGTLEVQQRKFRAIDISHFFDAVVFSDEFGREHWKPSTIPFQAALDRLDVRRGEDAVYVASTLR